MIHPVKYVEQFHRLYGHPISTEPSLPDAKLRLLRCRLLIEEVLEFCEASGFPLEVIPNPARYAGGWARMQAQAGDFPVTYRDLKPEDSEDSLVDIVEVADAIGDINVVNNGAALTWGIPIQEIDAEIHRSNMSKLGEDGKPITDEHGKTMKGPNYFKPDIAGVLFKR